MTQCAEEIRDIAGTRWDAAKQIIGDRRVTLGPQASDQYLNAPEHLAMVLARYRAAAALIGDAKTVIEFGCGEGIGAGILAKGRYYLGFDKDAEAIRTARKIHKGAPMDLLTEDAISTRGWNFHAAVALDVIEHIPSDQEDAFLESMTRSISAEGDHGVCVIGTPNAAFEHLASPQSRAGHVNLYTHDRLHALMSKHFRVVQSFGMQDTSLHLGHPDARHYLLMCGIGPRTP